MEPELVLSCLDFITDKEKKEANPQSNSAVYLGLKSIKRDGW